MITKAPRIFAPIHSFADAYLEVSWCIQLCRFCDR